MDITEILFTKYPDDMMNGNISLKEENDGKGVVIGVWKMPIPQPTIAEVLSYEAAMLPIFTLNNLRNQIVSAINLMMDKTAQSKTYANSISCVSYVNSTNSQWQKESQLFIAWRDSIWTYCIGEFSKAQAGTRTFPAVQEFLTELPVINW